MVRGEYMEIHSYESMAVLPEGKYIIHDWKAMNVIWEDLHNNPENLSMTWDIHTTQMCMLSSTWLHKGCRIFVHQDNGIVYEITLKSKGGTGDRAVRDAQNVYAMWAGNVFRE
jgi:hypothetical protein